MILPEEARRDDRAAACRGGRPVPHQACCPEPASRSAPVLWSARVLSSEQEWQPAPALPVVRPALPAQEKVSPSVPAQDGSEELLREAEPGESERGARRTVPEAAAWVLQPPPQSDAR
nr:hypothetical protein [Bradyrhizobium sp. WBOS07]